VKNKESVKFCASSSHCSTQNKHATEKMRTGAVLEQTVTTLNAPIPVDKERCNACAKVFVNLSRHKKCSVNGLLRNVVTLQVNSIDHSVSQQSSACADQRQPGDARTTRMRRKSQERGRVTGGTRK